MTHDSNPAALPMPQAAASRPAFVPKPGDGWVHCRCGARHWGVNGAAGLFLVRGHAKNTEVLLQHRALWSHQGGTWSIPGGAIMDGEVAVSAALREAQEETGFAPAQAHVIGTTVLDHIDWSYTTVIARAVGDVNGLVPTDSESIEVSWQSLDALLLGNLDIPLLPAFRDSLPGLAEIVYG